jgi:hypothetical protein
MKIIALSGKAGTGKDFIYENYLFSLGWRKWSLADHFKIWVVGKGDATYEEVFYTKPSHVRTLLQREGTERGRLVYTENIWLDTAYGWMTHLSKTLHIDQWCLTDVRFRNEAKYVREHGGKVYRLIAPVRNSNNGLTEEARQHISETDLDNVSFSEYFDGYIYNDPTDDDMHMQIQHLLKNI